MYVMEKKPRIVLRDRHSGEPLTLPNLKTGGVLPTLPLPLRGTYLGVRHPIALRTADLRQVDLREADVTGKDLSDADLTGALLDGLKYDRFTRWPAGFDPLRLGAMLVPPDCGGQNCDGFDFTGFDLSGANFAGASAVGASFVGAVLTNAVLTGMTLTDACLDRATLQGANLSAAKSLGASFVDTDLTGVLWNKATVWPEGFTPPAPPENEPETIEALSNRLKTLGDPARLRLLGLLLREPQTGEELAAALGLSEPTISHHLSKLREAGLTETLNRVHQARSEAVDALGEGLGERLKLLMEAEEPADKFAKKVLDAFFENGRLKSIPARQKKQRIVLERLVAEFEPGVRYTEMQLSEKLRAFHEDVATLRRLFIAERLMARENSVYWRL